VKLRDPFGSPSVGFVSPAPADTCGSASRVPFRERLQQVLDYLNDGVYLTDRTRRVLL